MALKPDNSLVTGGEDSTVRLWDSSGAPLGSQPTAGPVTALAVSTDGQHIATGDSAGTLQMRNGDGTPAGAPISDIGTPIDGLAFTPDGERLVVSAQDQPPQLRNQAGELVSQAAPEAGAETTTEGNLAGLWQRLQSLGPRLWILLPILLLAILLWSLLQGVLGDGDEDEDEGEASGGEATFAGAGAADLPSTPGADIDWSAASDRGEADFGATDFGATDFGQADFGQADAADFELGGAAGKAGGEPSFFEADGPDAGQGLDRRLAKAKAALERGQALAQAGSWQEALDAANQAIESADVERLKALGAGASVAGVGAIIARGMMRRGGILTALKRPEEALKSYDRALQLEPNDPDTWIGKGNLLLTQNRSDEALFCFDKAIELSPQSGNAWQGKGEALQQMDRAQDAQAALAQAATLGTDDAAAPIQSGIGAALGGGFAALGAAASRLRPDPVVDDAPEDDDLPPDLRETLDYLPETADTPAPNSPDAPAVAVPTAEDMPWEAEEAVFIDEDVTVIQAGSEPVSPPPQWPDQDAEDETVAFDQDDEDDALEFAIETDDANDEADNDTVGFSVELADADTIDFGGGGADLAGMDLAGMDLDSIDDEAIDRDDDTVEFTLASGDELPSADEDLGALLDSADTPVDPALDLDTSLEPSDWDDLGAVFGGDAAPIDLTADDNDDEFNLSLSDDDEFEIALAPSDGQDNEDLAIDTLSDDQLDFSLDGDLEAETPAIALDDDADPFSDRQSPAELTEDVPQEQGFDGDIPDELLTALEGISGFPAAPPVAQNPPAGSPPISPPNMIASRVAIAGRTNPSRARRGGATDAPPPTKLRSDPQNTTAIATAVPKCHRF
ncbi:MAG: tetratricopeptide repeat protein, partial [Leptolyngbya sp. RL_3_1]|nr:tetratricopeptide repeat protein [Leptolyngbya sp. RL_3_1]